jgi:agmatinase
MLVLSHCAHAEQANFPSSFIEKIAPLNEQQKSFILNGKATQFVPHRQLVHEVQTRDLEGITLFVDDLMRVAQQMTYDPKTNMGAIPLNLKTRSFNNDVVTPQILLTHKRAAGPFSVNRYLFPESGIATFAGANLAIYPDDLIAGEVDVAIIGIPSDMGSGQRSANFAPSYMRMTNTMATVDEQSLVNPSQVLSIADYGDFTLDRWSAERSINHIAQMVAETSATGATPFIVGGDTSILYATVSGAAQHHGKQSFGLVHFSAHSDNALNAVHTVSDEQVISRLVREGIIEGKSLIQIGLRGPSLTPESLQWFRDNAIQYYTMAQFDNRGFEKTLKNIKRDYRRGPSKWFISIDVSAVNPSDIIAAGRIEAGGLEVDQIKKALRHFCASKEIVGFEITDLAPMLDLSKASVTNANALVNACLNGVALRKAGIKPDYIHPLTREDGE